MRIDAARAKSIDSVRETAQKYIAESQRFMSEYQRENLGTTGSILDQVEYFFHFMGWVADTHLRNAPRPVQTLFTKAARCLIATYQCLRIGGNTEAKTLLRTLFETDVTLKYMLKENAERRMELYDNYGLVDEWERILKKRKNGQTIELESGEEARIASEYARVRGDYAPRRASHWAWSEARDAQGNCSFAQLCRLVGRVDEYEAVYQHGSLAVHSAPQVRLDFYFAPGKITTMPLFDIETVEIAALSVAYGDNVLKESLEYLKPTGWKDILAYSLYLADRVAADTNNLHPDRTVDRIILPDGSNGWTAAGVLSSTIRVGKADTLKAATKPSPKPGRNSLCPCGSGKKFKRCCGRANDLERTVSR